MNNKLKETFDKIHAESELKTQTKEFIAYKTKNYTSQKKFVSKRMIPIIACFIFLLFSFSGYQLYFAKTTIISIDINPSIELNINRFDRVISINSYNDDGLQLINTIDIQFMNYISALNEILNTESIAMYLNRNEMLSISVAGQNERKSKEILENIEAYIPNQQNICCYMGNLDDVKEAHSVGLSFGKYRAFLELQKVNPDITIDDVKGLTMREIRDLINNSNAETPPTSNENTENNGNKHRYRYRHGTNEKAK